VLGELSLNRIDEQRIKKQNFFYSLVDLLFIFLLKLAYFAQHEHFQFHHVLLIV